MENNKKFYNSRDWKKVKNFYRPVYRRGMNKNEYRILWTALWMLFIGGLCFIFNSALPLSLLLLWMAWL